MKKLNRSKLLGMVTAGAIVVTTAFSFAAWGTLTDKAVGEVTIDKPATVVATAPTFQTTGDGYSADAPIYTGTVQFEVGVVNDTDTFTVESLITSDSAGETPVAKPENYTVTIMKGSTPVISGTPVAAVDGLNEYTVTVTPKEGTITSDTTVYVGLKGTLAKVGP